MKKTLLATAIMLGAASYQGLGAYTVERSNPIDMKVEINKQTPLSKNNRTVNPLISKEARLTTRTAESTGPLLKEDFQGWDGRDQSWLPDGWTRENKLLPADNKGWFVYAPATTFEEIRSTCLVVQQYKDPIDTWVITPSLRVEDGMVLSFLTYPTPLYYFDYSYIDWNAFEFTEMHLVNDFKVYVTEDNGNNWTLLKSLAADFENTKSYSELQKLTKETEYNLDLSAYGGKDIKIGFNVWGIDEGNTAMLDNVSVGYPALNVSYARPDGSLFFGLTSTDQNLPVSILTVPAYSPVKFTNTSKDSKSSFSWTYYDATGEQRVEDQKNLTVTYTPDYSDGYTATSLYDMPVLSGAADKHSTTEYSLPGFLQAGGQGEYEAHFTDGTSELLNFGLSVVDPVGEGTATYADFMVPYFGYNELSDYFWTDRMLNGDPNYNMDENTYCHLESIGNLFFATDEPLVISGVRANGYGILSRETCLKAEIYLIDKDWVVPETPYATAICTGDDITIIDRLATNFILSFNFKFDKPIVMSKALTPYYFVTISGFRDAKNVEYFSPEMSAVDNADKLGLGWVGLKQKFEGNEAPMSWSAVANNIDRYVAFYIMVDAAFPWLEPKSDFVYVGDGYGELMLDSYYDVSELTVEGLPSWLKVEGSGRFGETKLAFTSTGQKTDFAVVTIKAPGFEKKVTVSNNDTNSIESIINDENAEIYNLQGVRLNKNSKLDKGIYIINGKKVMVK